MIFKNLTNEEKDELLTICYDALFNIKGQTHSWVMSEETAHIVKPIHDKYRMMADGALDKVEEKL